MKKVTFYKGNRAKKLAKLKDNQGIKTINTKANHRASTFL